MSMSIAKNRPRLDLPHLRDAVTDPHGPPARQLLTELLEQVDAVEVLDLLIAYTTGRVEKWPNAALYCALRELNRRRQNPRPVADLETACTSPQCDTREKLNSAAVAYVVVREQFEHDRTADPDGRKLEMFNRVEEHLAAAGNLYLRDHEPERRAAAAWVRQHYPGRPMLSVTLRDAQEP